MGAQEERYVNTAEDYLEKGVKKKKSINDIVETTHCGNVDNLFKIILQPNEWNIIHLICWYNNHKLLKELLEQCPNTVNYINEPDVNKEPPVAICCVVDAVECLELLLNAGALREFKDDKYRSDLNLHKLCAYHDAAKCFSYLNPDLSIESVELDDCYDIAKKNGADNIAELYDDKNMYEGLDSIVEIKEENSIPKITLEEDED